MARFGCIHIFYFYLVRLSLQDPTLSSSNAVKKSTSQTNSISKTITHLYDYQTNKYATKNLMTSACYIEFAKQEGVPLLSQRIGESKPKHLPKIFIAESSLSKKQIWDIAGERILEFCKGFPTFLLQEIDAVDDSNNIRKNGISKRSTSHYFVGRLRGQTQSQYLNFGSKPNSEGKAEAEITNGGSKAIVVANNGMGQAQSQSNPMNCEECYSQSHYPYPSTNNNIPPPGYGPSGQTIPSGAQLPNGYQQPNFHPSQTNFPGPDSNFPSGKPTGIQPGYTGNEPISGTHPPSSFIPEKQPSVYQPQRPQVYYPSSGGSGQYEQPGVYYPDQGVGGSPNYPSQPDVYQKPTYPTNFNQKPINQFLEKPASKPDQFGGDNIGVSPEQKPSYGVGTGTVPGGVTGVGHKDITKPEKHTPGQPDEGNQGFRPGQTTVPEHPISPEEPSYPIAPNQFPGYYPSLPSKKPVGPGGGVSEHPAQFYPGTSTNQFGRPQYYPTDNGHHPPYNQYFPSQNGYNIPKQPSTSNEEDRSPGKFGGHFGGDYDVNSGRKGTFSGIFSGQFDSSHYSKPGISYGKHPDISKQPHPNYGTGNFYPSQGSNFKPSEDSGKPTYERPGNIYQEPAGVPDRFGFPSGGSGTFQQPDRSGFPTGTDGRFEKPHPGGKPIYTEPGVGTFQQPSEFPDGSRFPVGAGGAYEREPGPSGQTVYEKPGVSKFQQPAGFPDGTGEIHGKPPKPYNKPIYEQPGVGGIQQPTGYPDRNKFPSGSGGSYGKQPGSGWIKPPGNQGPSGTYSPPSGSGYPQQPGSNFNVPSGSQFQPDINQNRFPGYTHPPSSRPTGSEGNEFIPQNKNDQKPFYRPGEGTSNDFGNGNYYDDSDSQAQTSVHQVNNETQASASSMGKYEGGTAQSQVSGTYSGSGSFSALAGSDDGKRGALTQVSGGKQGAVSAAQGHGGLGRSQAQVQLASETGQTISSAQSGGQNYTSQTQVQGGEQGGMADAQSNGSGSTSSQAQIGFVPYNKNEELSNQATPFLGGGTASAQGSSRSGQAQSQVQGKFLHGIKYTGGAQAGSGSIFRHNATLKGFAKFPPLKFSFEPFKLPDFSKTSLSNDSSFLPVSSDGPNVPQELPTTPNILDYNKGSLQETSNSASPYINTLDNSTHNALTATPSKTEASTEEDYEYEDETETEKPQAKVVIAQNSPTQNQEIALDSLKNQDATVMQSFKNNYGQSFDAENSMRGSFEAPPGFRTSIKHVAVASPTNVFTKGSNSQAQSVNLKPGTGKVLYIRPKFAVSSSSQNSNQYNGVGYGYSYHPYSYQFRSADSSAPNFHSVSRTETGIQNPSTGEKTPSLSYTQASSCGMFTATCVFKGSGKVCFPQLKTSKDDSIIKC